VIVIPAVDVREGRCVRLREGRASSETVFSDDPVAMAERWAAQGAERLHVVDLDGAFGHARQTALIAKMIAAVAPVPLEVGGGLRDLAAIEAVLDAGARWAVVGTRAALDPSFLAEVCRAHPGRIIVAVDAKGDRVAVKGWTEVVKETVAEVGLRARHAGAASLLYTDVSRDGMEQGPNVEYTAEVARVTGMPVLASGGVASVDDLIRLATIEGVEGTVVGRALYTGAVDLRHARQAVSAVGAAGQENARSTAAPSAGFGGAIRGGGSQGAVEAPSDGTLRGQ
jgi:phosphoribosylformimino-5-aminoimidazole carboxamide ribotide isomerase